MLKQLTQANLIARTVYTVKDDEMFRLLRQELKIFERIDNRTVKQK